MPTVQDLCDSNIELNDPVDSGVLDPCEGGTIIRTFTATDQCGNDVSATQTVTLLPDSDIPTFTSTLPTDMTVDCDNVPTAPIIEADDCNAVSVEFDESVVIIQCGQVITRTWVATDVCGNSVSHTQIINVECPIDGNISDSAGVNCNNPNGGTATATVTGGQAPFTYLWDNGETTATAVNLDNGPHSVVVTDVSGCQITLNTVIEGDFTAPTVTATGGTIDCSAQGMFVTLIANTDGTVVQWTGPNGFTSTQASPVVDLPGTCLLYTSPSPRDRG